MKSLFFSVFVLTISIEVNALSCEYIIGPKINEDKVINTAYSAEELIGFITSLYSTHPYLEETLALVINGLSKSIEKSLDFDYSNPKTVESYLQFEKQVERLKTGPLQVLEKTHQKRMGKTELESKNKKMTWSDIANSPQTVEGEKVYTVDRDGKEPLDVVFSEKLVSKVLKSSDSLISSAAVRALNSLNGTGGASGTGVVRLQLSKDVYEVRTKGKTGVFRLFGYMDQGTLHIVHWSKDSGHSTSSLHRSAATTLAIRATRGHK